MTKKKKEFAKQAYREFCNTEMTKEVLYAAILMCAREEEFVDKSLSEGELAIAKLMKLAVEIATKEEDRNLFTTANYEAKDRIWSLEV